MIAAIGLHSFPSAMLVGLGLSSHVSSRNGLQFVGLGMRGCGLHTPHSGVSGQTGSDELRLAGCRDEKAQGY